MRTPRVKSQWLDTTRRTPGSTARRQWSARPSFRIAPPAFPLPSLDFEEEEEENSFDLAKEELFMGNQGLLAEEEMTGGDWTFDQSRYEEGNDTIGEVYEGNSLTLRDILLEAADTTQLGLIGEFKLGGVSNM